MTGAEAAAPPPRIVVGGVSGSGKSTLGAALAAKLGAPFIDGDDLHSEAAKAKMHRGEPLTDADRAPWLDRVAAALAAEPRGAVIACSALKRAYRDRLRAGAPGVVVLLLDAPRAAIETPPVPRTSTVAPGPRGRSARAQLRKSATGRWRRYTLSRAAAPA